MAHNRMDDFGVAIDPHTGELHSAARYWRRTGRPGRTPAGFNWRPLAFGAALLLVLMLGVFALAVVSELT